MISKHPWAVRRTRIGYTQVDIADALRVSRQFVIRLEKSLFHEPSPYVLLKLSGLYSVSPAFLLTEYKLWATSQRQEFKRAHLSFKEVLQDYHGMEHPLIYYRGIEKLSRMGLCKGLCLDYGPVSEYEANKQRGLPLIIKLAAQEIYWDYAPLESAVSEWRSDGRADWVRNNTGRIGREDLVDDAAIESY